MGAASVSDEIYNRLYRRIIDKEWLMGTKIPSESQLCKEFDVSRISVRSALQRLQAQDLLVTRPGKGSYVISNGIVPDASMSDAALLSISQSEYQHFVEFRRGIEFYSAELMCVHGTEEDFARLEQALEGMAGNPIASPEFIDNDLQFHAAIIAGSHNPIFISMMNLCEQVYKTYLCETNMKTPLPQEKIVYNHRRIFEAIKSHDAKEARSILSGNADYNLKLYFAERK